MTERFSRDEIKQIGADHWIICNDENIRTQKTVIRQLLADRDKLVEALTRLSEYNNFGDAFDMEEYAQKALDEVRE